MTPFQNTGQGGSNRDYAIREGTTQYPNVGLRNAALSNPRDRKTPTNLHSQGPSPMPPGLQSTLTTATPPNQEVASSTDVDPPPEYDYGESTRRWPK